MNNKRRALLEQANGKLDEAQACISQALDGEQDSLDNIPENLQSSEKYEKMEDTVALLETAIDDIDSIKENISEAIAQ